ncbi:MAG TPA: DUF4838 domain-containing protein [Candidatus Binataceae bacterium]|nr:DUF4838 domain-containing protein [Candidatus Binataceae bacterium]
MSANRESKTEFPRIIVSDATPDTRQAQVTATAAGELAAGLAAMLSRPVNVAHDPTLGSSRMRVELDARRGGAPADPFARDTLAGDSFAIARADDSTIAVGAGSARGLIHAAADLLEHLGARFAAGASALYPQIDADALRAITPYRVTPSFSRRAFVSDIMTWNYGFADRLELHLRHDREFIPWLGRRGANAFSYIRHAHDTRLKIDEIQPLFEDYGIALEYGGHVLQILLPRERFQSDPAMFPAGDDGTRMARGNLCVSNPAALELVREGAVKYVADYPENELLHIWGADVWKGAWCRCGKCRELAPQLQYMDVVNAVAESLAERGAAAPPVAYLAYHDTLEPHPGLRPLPNVWFEWAPRERCYSHAIDDPACEINPPFLESLKRYLEIFDGRAHIFEYYADAILFGGLAFATPGVVARDLRAYRSLGISSVTCLTFGAFSTLAYPVNLEAFVRCARDVAFEPDAAISDTALGRHPRCAPALDAAYRAVERASLLSLDFADVMRPQMSAEKGLRKRGELKNAARAFDDAIAAAESISRAGGNPLARAEQQLWTYSGRVLDGLSAYLAAKEQTGAGRIKMGDAAIAQIADAIAHVREIDLEVKGTWGAYDLEWIRELWIAALKRGLEEKAHAHEEIF